jgi:hypothetical protein
MQHTTFSRPSACSVENETAMPYFARIGPGLPVLEDRWAFRLEAGQGPAERLGRAAVLPPLLKVHQFRELVGIDPLLDGRRQNLQGGEGPGRIDNQCCHGLAPFGAMGGQ